MTLVDYTKYLDAIDFEDFGQIERILKKYKFRMVIQQIELIRLKTDQK